MSRVSIDDTILTNVANSIRSKDGGSDNISPLDFAQRILDIPEIGRASCRERV